MQYNLSDILTNRHTENICGPECTSPPEVHSLIQATWWISEETLGPGVAAARLKVFSCSFLIGGPFHGHGPGGNAGRLIRHQEPLDRGEAERILRLHYGIILPA